MKMTLLFSISILSIIISTTLLLGNRTLDTIKVGDKAPDFVLKDQDGKVHKLSDYRGQRVIVYYFPKADTPG
jgi:peroxiredoxin